MSVPSLNWKGKYAPGRQWALDTQERDRPMAWEAAMATSRLSNGMRRVLTNLAAGYVITDSGRTAIADGVAVARGETFSPPHTHGSGSTPEA